MPTDRARESLTDPPFTGAVMRALHGDLNPMAMLDAGQLPAATRSMSVLVAGAVGLAALEGPSELARVTFWVCDGHLTFAPTDPARIVEPLHSPAAHLVAMDANALIVHCDFGPVANSAWAGLCAALPADHRRKFALLLAARFSTPPIPAVPPVRAPDPSWRTR